MSIQRSRFVFIADFLFRRLKTPLAIAVVGFVVWQFARILTDPAFDASQYQLRAEYLVPAGLLYLGAHTIWATFWWQMLRSQQVALPWLTAVRIYFVSQFGKYVPGKIWVISMRMSMLDGRASKLVVAVTGVYESLTSMAAGSLIGIALLPYAGVDLPLSNHAGWALIAIAATPLSIAMMTKLVKRLRKSDAIPTPPLWLLTLGLVQAAVAWCLLAVSLGCVVRAVVPAPPAWGAAATLADLTAVSLSYVAGFVMIFIPGGLGAREWVLKEMLTPRLLPTAGTAAAATAVIVALVLRLVWTAAEVMVAGTGWLLGTTPRPARTRVHDPA